MSSAGLSASAKRNVEAVAQVAQQLLGRRSRVERLGDGIARFFGSLRFIAAHAVFFAGWVVLNLGVLPGVRPFDPYPFPFLGFVVGVEFILLTTFVLMRRAAWQLFNKVDDPRLSTLEKLADALGVQPKDLL